MQRKHFLIGAGRKTAVVLIALAMGFAVILGSCGDRRGSGLKRHDLFTIPLGTLPGEMDWFYREGFRMAGTADIQAKDGLIFISGGASGKVMVFNSYGDLITFVYDPAKTAAPASVDDSEDLGSVSNWPFRNPGLIAPFDGGFLVEDGVERERRVEDGEFGALYDRVVLRFDRDGSYLGHLGREGYGGSPFPYIDSLDVREDGGVVVTCRIPGAWMSYWFDASGHPVTTVRIQENQLPGLGDSGTVAVYSVRPDPLNWTLYLRLDAYVDSAEGGMPEPRLYSLDLSTLEYSEPVILTYSNPSEQTGLPAIPPEYLGTTIDGSHMMLSTEGPELYRLTLVDSQGRIIQNRRLKVDSTATVYRKFRLQNDGLLTGIFLGSNEATVSWWRVDKLIGNESS